jgi:hypothetical protein
MAYTPDQIRARNLALHSLREAIQETAKAITECGMDDIHLIYSLIRQWEALHELRAAGSEAGKGETA